jgi:hypothetical protein
MTEAPLFLLRVCNSGGSDSGGAQAGRAFLLVACWPRPWDSPELACLGQSHGQGYCTETLGTVPLL